MICADSETTDIDLIRAMTRLEEGAFTSFYDRHVPVVFALLSRIIPEAADREEVLQEAFWQVWQQAGSYDPLRGSPLAWLIQIARSRALDRLRQVGKARRRNGGSLDEQMETIERQLQVPNRIGSAEGEDTQMVQKALLNLPFEQREALTLAYVFGMTHVEIAEKLKAPLGTVKTRIQRGIHKLREFLS
ncbi:MAG: sigma-70 family RNA polymerase sigma factor [Nitrospirota bacterium]